LAARCHHILEGATKMKVKIADIKPGKNYSRTFGIGDVSGLALSLQEHGLIQPIIIDASNNLIAGFRRFAAAASLAWDEIECIVRPGSKAGVINLIENMNRQGLTLWEEIQGMKDVFGNETDAEVARQLSKSNSFVRPRTAIWKMDSDFITKVRLGEAGLVEIKRRMCDNRGPSAVSKNMGVPTQPDVRRMVTWLMEQGREWEANALSFACGGLTETELKEIDYEK